MKYIVQDKILIQVANPYEVQKQALFIAYKNFIAMFYSFGCHFIQQRFHRASFSIFRYIHIIVLRKKCLVSLNKKKLLFGHFFCWRMMYENKLGLILLLLMAINWTCQESHSKISHSDPKNETFIYTFQIISEKMDNLFVYVMTALNVF